MKPDPLAGAKLLVLALAAAWVMPAFGQTLSWDGGGDGVSWHDPANWVDDRLPASTNHVVIAGTNLSVTFSTGNVSVRSIQCAGGFNLSGGTLTVTSSNSQFSGAFTVSSGATLVVRGTGTELLVNGPTAYQGGSLQPQQGGTLRLPQLRRIDLTNQHLNFVVSSAGSTLDLSAVTNVALNGRILNISALGGGRVDLSRAHLSGVRVDLYVDGGLLDLSAESGTGIASDSSLEVRYGGEIRMPGLTALTNTLLTIRGSNSRFPTAGLRAFVDGTLTVRQVTNDFSNLTNLSGSWINVELDAALLLTNVTELSMKNGNVSFSAYGPRCLLDLSGVTNVEAGYWFSLEARYGGVINLSRAQIPDGPLYAWAYGAGSLVDLSGMQNRLSESSSSTWDLDVSDGGRILLPNITELNRARLSIADTGVIEFGPVEAITRSTVWINGATVSLTNLVNTFNTTFNYQNGGQIIFPPAVDLVVTDAQCPAAAVAGQLVEVSWTVRNQGTNPASGSRADAIYLSTDRSVGNDVFLGHFASVTALPAGAAVTVTNTVIPPSSLKGDYNFIVVADSLYQFYEGEAETNNTFIATNTITLTAPDLQVTSVTAPGAAQFGSTFDVTWVVKNNGSATANQVWYDRLYLATNSTSLAGATVLRTFPACSTLAPGTSYTNTQAVMLPQPAGAPAGGYFLTAAADWNNVQSESSDTNNAGSRAINVTWGPLPDLLVTHASAPPAAIPGQSVNLIWAITNRGNATASAVWSETVSFSNELGSVQALEVFDYTNSLAAGGSLWRTQAVVLPLTFPAGTNLLLVELDTWRELLEQGDENNTGCATNPTTIAPTLSLQLPVTQVYEGVAEPLLLTLARNDRLDQPLLITLSVSDTNEVSLPAAVQMPAGLAAGTVELHPLRDGQVDGPKNVVIGASAPGYPSVEQALSVLDVDAPRLALAFVATNVTEGMSLTAFVSSDVVSTNPVTVLVESSNPSQVTAPASVTIPAGSNYCTFEIAPVDDALLELAATYTVTVSAPGYVSSAAAVTVVDNDLPTVTLTLAQRIVSEAAGAEATLATVTRNIVSSRALAVEVVSSDPAARVPPRVVIPANQAALSFAVAAVDNAVEEGPRSVMLTPYVLSSTANVRLAEGVSDSLTVLDDDGPALRVAVLKKLVGEGLNPATSVNVSRNSPATNALVVELNSSEPSEATVPASVTLPLGAASGSFDLVTVADGTNDGNQTVTLTASAPGFTPGYDTVVVTDLPLPDLRVENITVPGTAETESYVSAGYRVGNQGLSPTASNFLTRVFFSHDPLIGDDTLAGEFRFQGMIGAGQHFEQSLQVRLPQTAGDLWVVVQTDAEQELPEALEDNNASLSATPIHVRAAYGAYVETSVGSELAGTPVPLTGRATNGFGAGVPFKLVNLHLQVRDTERIISALSDADGNFATTFQPLANEAGAYGIFATHPGVAQGSVQDAFVLLGMRARPASASVKVVEQASATKAVRLENLGELPLTGLSAIVLAKPAGIEVTPSFSNPDLPGLGTNQLQCVFTAGTGASSGPVQVRVTSAEGAFVDVSFTLRVEDLRPRLVATPPSLMSGMVRGQQRQVEFQVVNEGGEATGPLTVMLPTEPWLHLACTNPLPPLGPGETNVVTLLLMPAADLPIGAYSGRMALGSANATLQVPYEFRALSEAKGDLLVTVVDELTAYAEGAPKVAGAQVVVRDALSKVEVATGITDTNGLCMFSQLPEAFYDIEVTAKKHDGARYNLLVLAGQTNTLTAFVSYQTVQYVWSIVPVETEDRYRISVETVFETVVPAPVVTIEPKVIDLAAVTGDTARIELRISNHGLIAAQNMRLRLPTHPDWTFSTLVTEIGALPAASSLTIPLRIQRVKPGSPAPPISAVGTRSRSPKDGGPSGPCGAKLDLGWELECMGMRIGYSTQVNVHNAQSGCGSWHPLLGGCCIPCRAGANCPPPGPPGTGSSEPDPQQVFTTGESYTSLGICNCGWFDELCLEAKWGLDPKGLADKLKAKILELLQNTQGVVVKNPEIEIGISGNLCTCCEGNNISYKGSAKASASVKITVAIGLAGQFNPTAVSGWTNVTAAAYGVLGLELQLAGSVSLELAKECAGKADLCANGELKLTALVGATGELIVAANPTEPIIIGTNSYLPGFSGTVQGRAGIEGDLTAKVSGCLGEGSKIELCGELWSRLNASGSLKAEIPAGEGSLSVSKSISFNWDVLLGKAGFCGKPGMRASKNEEPIVVELTRDDFLVRDSELYRRFGVTPLPRSGVCAHVKLRLDQDAVVSREAFHANLTLDNSADTPLEQVQMALTVQDADGRDASDRFLIQPPRLEGVSAADGSGLLPAGSSGSARWAIIPTAAAAPTAASIYWMAGRLKYAQDGAAMTMPLAPTPFSVLPSPSLRIDYFHDRDVFSDDPFTDELEPSVPYNLAVLVQNQGYGTARNFQITSAQPQIVDNEKGLLIDFKILATEVAGQNLVPTLTADFGDITNHQAAIGRWLLTSTLQGFFINYSASFEHLDANGEPRSSIIDQVAIHEMIHLVQAGGAFADGKPDFLVNDVPDPFDRPDTLWLSDGTALPVSVVEMATHDGAPSAADLVVRLSVSMPAEWSYLRIFDPANGRFRLTRVVRSDGNVIALGTNVWTTDRTFIGLGRRPTRENILHLLDHHAANTAEVYTLTYTPLPAPDLTAPSSRVGLLPSESGNQIPVAWSGADDSNGSGLAFFDVYVSENRGVFAPWLQQTTLNGAIYTGTHGGTYAFFSVATDRAGNREASPTAPDATTSVTLSNRPPALAASSGQVVDEGREFTFTLTATDPDLPNDWLTFSLSGAPVGMTIHPDTGFVRWLTGERDGPSTNRVTVIVRDNGLPALSATNVLTVEVCEVNSAPVPTPIADRTINEGFSLVINNTAADTDLPRNVLTYGFGASAPARAFIHPQTGVFTWRPTDTQGPSTNLIKVFVSDNGTPSLSATQQFTVIVRDSRADFTVNVGSTNILAGESNAVAIWLNSGLDLQSLSFDLEMNNPVLAELALHPVSPEVGSVALLPSSPNRWQLNFTAVPGMALRGTMPLGVLSFTASSNGPSAIVPLRVSDLAGVQFNWLPTTNGAAFGGRVIVVAQEPVLWCERRALPGSPDQVFSLQIYGQPDHAYELQWSTNLAGLTAWEPWLTLPQTNRVLRLDWTNAGTPALFLRAREP